MGKSPGIAELCSRSPPQGTYSSPPTNLGRGPYLLRSWTRSSLANARPHTTSTEEVDEAGVFRNPQATEGPRALIFVETNASNAGRGFQVDGGQQGTGRWLPYQRKWHTSVKELMVVWLFPKAHLHIRDTSICFHMDNQEVVNCMKKQGSSRSLLLLQVLEKIFCYTNKGNICLTVTYPPGSENLWADMLSRQKDSSVEWSIQPQVFQSLTDRWGDTRGGSLHEPV